MAVSGGSGSSYSVHFGAVLGTCVIDVNQSGDVDYDAAPELQQSFAVGASAQAVNFTSSAPTETYRATSSYTPTFVAGGSGNPVVVTIDASSSSGTCTVVGDVVSFSSPGSCVIDANQAGSTDYLAASQVQQIVTVNKAPQVLAFTSTPPAGATYRSGAGSTYAVVVTSSGDSPTLSIDSSSSTGACTLSGNTVTYGSAVGTCTIDANSPASAHYDAATQIQQSFIITKAAQSVTITSDAPAGATVSGSNSEHYSVTAVASSGLAVTMVISSSSTEGCTISGATVSYGTHEGTCVIATSANGNADYLAAPQVEQSFGVGSQAQSINFTSSPPSETYGSTSAYTLAATGGGSGNPVTYSVDSASGTDVCTISGGVVHFVAGGHCVIDANESGNDDYLAASQVQQVVTVAAAAQRLTFVSNPPLSVFSPLGNVRYSPVVTASSGLEPALSIGTTSTPLACSLDSGVVRYGGVLGICVIDAKQGGNADYLPAATATQDLVIGVAPQVLSFTSTAPTEVAGATTPYAPAVVGGSSGEPITLSVSPSSSPGTCSLSGTTVDFSDVGTCVITADQAGNTDYGAAVPVEQSIAVSSSDVNSSAVIPPDSTLQLGQLDISTSVFHARSVRLVVPVSLGCASGACSGRARLSVARHAGPHGQLWRHVTIAAGHFSIIKGREVSTGFRVTPVGKAILARNLAFWSALVGRYHLTLSTSTSLGKAVNVPVYIYWVPANHSTHRKSHAPARG